MTEANLKKIFFLQDLSPAELKSFAAIVRDRVVTTGTALFKEDEKPAGFYFVENGSVKLSRSRRKGAETVVIGSGGLFGELAFLHRKNRTAEAIALESTKVWEFPLAAIDQLLAANAALAHTIYRRFAIVLGERMRELPDDLSEIQTLKIRAQ